ncbi:hypothetical protein LEP1GSC103_0453 [Leptospira borgpetersenii serovar Javanica str. UI 09931]|uniref:Uncharacterized protein n=2 Tax=Leptospira borgpetersenii TaxID=174 RepID=A0ABP2S8R1_LEPBO|nr:hypothetical protein C4Q31_05920 [Leptospira borgpetersenii serovar Ceylonica]EKP14845.1 hypothetical protein LEP1GSC128_1492 [Leptospira borgpetersenii str. 200801926]EKQ92738.1 hypothetical protein LEP1GSC101_2862 [Leptospira borgpetersenii str. UI 09149]EKQ99804.1 hypothetical protein LEP1GSC121_2156 [Leptospira borgpetersenii serovar Castellonis str. 200801910]EMK12365.1 hypothetical protein LEP1GSC066_3248 [Leptospira sp. serovar Kenya str. Sh9]EMN56488.1 hypothetical protein LEP1GSC09
MSDSESISKRRFLRACPKNSILSESSRIAAIVPTFWDRLLGGSLKKNGVIFSIRRIHLFFGSDFDRNISEEFTLVYLKIRIY